MSHISKKRIRTIVVTGVLLVGVRIISVFLLEGAG